MLITLEFQPYLGATPPFSITPEEVQSYYSDRAWTALYSAHPKSRLISIEGETYG